LRKLRRELKDLKEKENKYSMNLDGAIIITTITTTMGGKIIIMEAGEIIIIITMDGVIKTSITIITTVGVTITVGEIITIITMVGETITTKIKELEDYGVMPYKELIGS